MKQIGSSLLCMAMVLSLVFALVSCNRADHGTPDGITRTTAQTTEIPEHHTGTPDEFSEVTENPDEMPHDPDCEHVFLGESNVCSDCGKIRGTEDYIVFEVDEAAYAAAVDDAVIEQATEIILPSKYQGYSVTKIGYCSFINCDKLESITIPASVMKIELSPFGDCDSLKSITVEEGNPNYHSDGNCLIDSSEKILVSGCTTSMIPDDGSVTSIGVEAFHGLDALETIVIPEGITNIENSAFYDCSHLTSILLPHSLEEIKSYAFYECSGLTSISIPENVRWIDHGAFAGCTGLNGFTVDENNQFYYAAGNCLIDINGTLIAGCKTSVIPDNGSVNSIGEDAFRKFSNLVSITIPDGIDSIGASAFAECVNLTSITIPDSVAIVGQLAFWRCDRLRYNSYENGLYLGNHDNAFVLFVKAINTSITTCEIHYYTNVICDSAFSGCNNLKSIQISDSVMYIGNWAFENCSSLTGITLPEYLMYIGDGAFKKCSSLKSIVIPEYATQIGAWAFQDCTSLTSITLPYLTSYIQIWTFSGCSSLTNIFYKGTKAYWRMIYKDSSWDEGTGNYTVHCTDGDIPK